MPATRAPSSRPGPETDPAVDGTWTSRRRTSARRVALLAVLVAAGVSFGVFGLPLDTLQVYAWVGVLLLAGCVGRTRTWILAAARQWVPFVGLILFYQFGYGAAGLFHKQGADPVEGDRNILGMPLHVAWPVHADRTLFGGTLPTTWVQTHAHHDGTPWFAWIVTVVYCSHFVFAPLAAVVLWWRGSPLFRPWLRGVLALAAMGLATYFLFPMAPPWLAAQQGAIREPVQRLIGEGWTQLHVTAARQLLDTGAAMSNPVAAMPSLHLATSLLAAVVLAWNARAWVRVLALLYPATMAASLVYGGEHYVVDELAGAAYALVIVLVWRVLAHRRTQDTGA